MGTYQQPLSRVRRWVGRLLLGMLILLLMVATTTSVMVHRGFERMEREGLAFLKEHEGTLEDRHGIRQVRVGNPDGPTLVLVHGSPGNWFNWSQFMTDPELLSRYYLIAVDRPGYGGSSPGDAELSMEQQAAELIRGVSDRPGPKLWVGHSFGAPIAARVAMSFPEEAQALVLLAGTMNPDLERPRWFHYIGDTAVGRYFIPTGLEVCNQECLAFDDELATMEPEWSNLELPVLVIHGTDDMLASYAHVPWVAERLPSASSRIVTLQGANHFIIWSHEEEISEAIQSLMDPPLAAMDRPGVERASP